MDKRFIAHNDYINNKANISCVLLKACLLSAIPRRLDSIEYIDDFPSHHEFEQLGYGSDDVIPIGDLAWIRSWLSRIPDAADPMLTPLEIPDAMTPFVGREYFHSLGRNLESEHLDGSKYFLKDIDVLKRWNSLLYDGDLSRLIESDTMYSISEKVNFLSEWRIFVLDDVEMGAYNYLGDPMLFPDKDSIHEMICSWEEADGEWKRTNDDDRNDEKTDNARRNRPRAYTLDVGVISKPDDDRSDEKGHITVPIEVHPFVACGLYGFSDPAAIADMLVTGYEWYRYDAPTKR